MISKNNIFKVLIVTIPIVFFIGLEFFSQKYLSKNYYASDIHLDSFPVWEFEQNYGPRLRQNPFTADTNTYKAFLNLESISGKMNFDETEGYIRMGAGDYILNKWGIKGPYFKEKKGKDIYRILVFGGSTTQGSFENELDYPRVLERMLNNKLNDKTYYQVINMGQVGSAICKIKKKVFEYLPKFKPDMIILTTGLNDFATSKNRKFKHKKNYCEFQLEKKTFLEKSHTYRLLKQKFSLKNLGPTSSISEMSANIDNNLNFYSSTLEDIILEAKKMKIEVGLLLSPFSLDLATPAAKIKNLPPWNNPYFHKNSKIDLEDTIALYQKHLIQYENVQKQLAKKHKEAFFIHNNLSIHTKGKKLFFFEEIHPSGPGYRVVALSIFNALNKKLQIHNSGIIKSIQRPMNKNELEILYLNSLFLASEIEDLSISSCVTIHGACTQIEIPFHDYFYASHAIAFALSSILQFPNEVKNKRINTKLERYLLKAEKKVKDFSLLYWILFILNQNNGNIEKAHSYKKLAYELNPQLENFSFEQHSRYFNEISIPNPFFQKPFNFWESLDWKMFGSSTHSFADLRYFLFSTLKRFTSKTNFKIETINSMFYKTYITSPLLARSLFRAWINILENRGEKTMAQDLSNKITQLKPEYEFNKVFQPK